MKMNFRNVMLACAALVAGFTSCSNDDVVDDSGIVPNGKATIAQISLTQQAKNGRAAATDAQATTAESKINKATLYIFNASKNFVKQVDFDVVTSPNSASKKVELTTGTHYFYALVNYPGTAPTFTTNATLATVTASVNNELALTAMSTITGATDGFLMSSLGEPVTKNLIEATQAEAETNNKVTLTVGRAMAKVNASFEIANPATDQPVTGKLEDVQYQGANNPNKMYALPNYVAGQIQAPYFTAHSGTNTVVQSEYFPALPTDFSMTTGWVDADGVENNAIYMAENSNQTPKEGNSSFLLIKGTFVPNANYCYDGTTGAALGTAIAKNTTFWCVATASGNVYKKRFFNADPTSKLGDITADINDGNTYTDVVEYRNGAAYYAFYLQDAMGSNRIAQYTTARNSYYGVTITSVSDLGANTPGGVITEPENPLGAEAWIHGEIEIADWYTIAQTGGI